MTPDLLRSALADSAWLDDAMRRVVREPTAIARIFPAAGRHCGRSALVGAPGWTTDDAARVVLLTALPVRGGALAVEVGQLYRYGSADEKRAVLRALAWLEVGADCVELLHDALRTNDTRLVAAALGPYARHLDDAAWRQAVLKCVFMDVRLSNVDDLDRRADAELATMLAGLQEERLAAGRVMPDDAVWLLQSLSHHLTQERVA